MIPPNEGKHKDPDESRVGRACMMELIEGEGLRSLLPRGTKGHGGSSLLDKRSQVWKIVGKSDAIIQIGKEIDAKFLGGGNQCLKGVPGLNPISGACLQTHIAFANPLSRPQFSRIIVQENFWMGKHHEQVMFLCQGPLFALIQELVDTGLPEELIKLGRHRAGLGRTRAVTIVQKALIELPEACEELLQELQVVGKTGDQFLVVTKFMDPAQRQFLRQRIELGSVVTD